MGDNHIIANFSPLPSDMLKGFIESYSDLTDIEVVNVHLLPEEEIVEKVANACVLFGDYTFKTPITKNIIRAAREARLIQQPTVGFEHIDHIACAESGLKLANAAGANEISVAEHTIMLALCLLKKLTFLDRRVHAGQWYSGDELNEMGVYEAYEKQYGLIGMGRIGKALAQRLKSFGMKVHYYDIIRLSPEEESEYDVTYLEFYELLKSSDIVSLHVPLIDATRGLIGEQELKTMKETAFLINVGRGGLVDEEALYRALKAKRIAGAALDVLSTEPVHEDHPLLGLDNVILTPHAAGTTREARPRHIEISIKNVIRALKGEEPYNVVN